MKLNNKISFIKNNYSFYTDVFKPRIHYNHIQTGDRLELSFKGINIDPGIYEIAENENELKEHFEGIKDKKQISRINELRKQVARMKTILRERELAEK